MATLAFTVVGFAMNGVLFVITPFLQIVQGNDAQGTGVRMLPMIGAMVVGAVTTDRVAKRFGSKLTIASGFAGTALGMLVLSRVGADSGYGLVALALVIMGLSIAFAMIPSLDAILASVPAGETGAGTALTRAIQNVAASFGVAVMGSILNNAYQSHLLPHLTGLPANVQSAAQASVAVAAAIAHRLPAPVGANLLRAADEAYAQGMGDVMLVTAAMTLVCAVAMALLLPSRASRTDKAAESTDLEARSA
jgi:predicted MFS family arabinose efflux permease